MTGSPALNSRYYETITLKYCARRAVWVCLCPFNTDCSRRNEKTGVSDSGSTHPFLSQGCLIAGGQCFRSKSHWPPARFEPTRRTTGKAEAIFDRVSYEVGFLGSHGELWRAGACGRNPDFYPESVSGSKHNIRYEA